MSVCGTPFIPAGKKFPVWECELPEGHGVNVGHGLKSLDWEKRTEIKTTYADAGRLAKIDQGHARIVTPQHRIPLDLMVKRTRLGEWSQASGPGKLLAILEPLQYEIHAMESEWDSGDGPVVERWLIAGNHGSRVKVSKTGSTWVYQHNGRIVSLNELIEEVIS